ncbi:hypothetical protein GCM10022631_33150 [Deinococcus rubellus]|uniref:Uncharacterized protein n=1 Tax=Deinococcus rubellus TaxID=1889240 RepID=A0ABY5YEV0_9DEIO|nr:hypothetical protein [Deinococcus rubellus]UWX63241.1 hypothetical protein N0D28_10825 [Deinococcus rubellus]
MKSNSFNVWLTVALCAGWAILLIRFVSLAQWPLAALSAVLLIAYGVRLYNLTKRP